jgi:Cytochrome c7 and related cytochrome c
VSRLRGLMAGERAAVVRAAARRLRPSSRTGVAKGIAAIAAVAAGVVIAVFVVGAAFSAFSALYDEYGFHPAENARSWAALPLSYADSTVCQRCHQPEYASWTASAHRTVVCESCHGPLATHAAETSPDAPAGSVVLAAVPASICVACHEARTGRPAGFPQVDLAQHYPGAACLWCHNPHDATAVRPPDIPHSLDRLPPCVTCHAPAGLKPVPAGHVAGSDSFCRSCHARPANGQ